MSDNTIYGESAADTSETPRTDAVQKAACGLGAGSNSVIPDWYPPCCPWELSRELEKENNRLKADVKQLTSNLAEQYKHSELLLNQVNKLQTENQKLRDDLADADRGNELPNCLPKVDEAKAKLIDDYFGNMPVKTRKMIHESQWQTREEFDANGNEGPVWVACKNAPEVSIRVECALCKGGRFFMNGVEIMGQFITHVMPRQARPEPPGVE